MNIQVLLIGTFTHTHSENLCRVIKSVQISAKDINYTNIDYHNI